MFLRMVKNSLKRKRLMNITLFAFIFLSAVIVCTGTAEIYYATVGLEHTFKVANAADYTLIKKQPAGTADNINAEIDKWAEETEAISEYSREEMIKLHYKQIDFKGIDEEDNVDFVAWNHYLGKLPKVHNKVRDLMDQPFTLASGEIAISSAWQETTGSKIGDTICLTTDMGNTYSFQVAYIFKDILYPMGSMYHHRRYFISDSDFEQMRSETALPVYMYAFKTSLGDEIVSSFKERSDYDSRMGKADIRESYMMQDIMVIVLVAASFFLIVIILLTLHFTIKVSLVEDEKEIGMMRAIGLPSFQFKGLYIASYLFLTLTGSSLGLLVGLPIAQFVTHFFSYNLILPNDMMSYLAATLAVIVMSALIVVFCFRAVSKIDKVPVVTALNEGIEGEKTQKLSKKSLYQRKRGSVASYMAFNDVKCGFRQYIVLICAYFLGTMILLFPQHVLNTLQSPPYLKYWDLLPSDFCAPYYNGNLIKAYEKSLKAGEKGQQIKMFSWLEEEAKRNGIDIQIDVTKVAHYDCYINDETSIETLCYFGEVDTRAYEYTKGSAPLYENEVAVADNLFRRYKLKIGQPIWLEIEDYDMDKTAKVKEKREFFITGTYQSMSNNGMVVRMGNSFESGVYNHAEATRSVILCEEQEKVSKVNRLKEIFDEGVIMTPTEYLTSSVADVITLMRGVILFLNVTILTIIFLMTLLYTRLIMAREIGSVALLKKIGFTETMLRSWQLIRITLLTSGAVIFGIIGSIVLGQPAATYCFNKMLNITQFDFTIHLVNTFIFTPMIIFAAVYAATLLSCRRIKTLKLHDISEN